MCDESVFGARIFDTTQIRHLIAFASAVDVTIQHFNESRQGSRACVPVF
jgi:hypothetical protein